TPSERRGLYCDRLSGERNHGLGRASASLDRWQSARRPASCRSRACEDQATRYLRLLYPRGQSARTGCGYGAHREAEIVGSPRRRIQKAALLATLAAAAYPPKRQLSPTVDVNPFLCTSTGLPTELRRSVPRSKYIISLFTDKFGVRPNSVPQPIVQPT